MDQLWKCLEKAAAQTPKSLFLRPGANESAIRAAERTMGLDFPADFRASLLLHDGQDWDEDGADDAFEWLPGQGRLASLDRIVEEWMGSDAETLAIIRAGCVATRAGRHARHH
jgi:cell wall assembly regulator SMI1